MYVKGIKMYPNSEIENLMLKLYQRAIVYTLYSTYNGVAE